ncbi:MAG: N-acetyltransferase, partial [Corynebacterium sp.]|nr:N-acetyltransferase [Corynebacterium sp.]
MTFKIRPMRRDDYAQVARIQQSGMDTGHATYEGEAPTWDGFTEHKIGDLMFVADEDGDVLGWVSAAKASRREVFAGVVEDSVY